MIKSFLDKETSALFQRESVKGWDRKLQRVALRKLLMLDAAEKLEDLRIPPANLLEKLHGDRRGNTASELTISGVFVFSGAEKMRSKLRSWITIEKTW